MWPLLQVSSKRSRALLVFSKSAERGNVKTRLRPVLTEEQCLALHLALLKDTIERVMQIEARHYLYLSSDVPLPFASAIPLRLQSGSDLGQRMENAFRETLAEHQSVLIVGTDSPALHPSVFNDAFAALDSSDLVLGPTEDGGYYLIAARSVIPEAFHDIPWGTPEVLSQTLKATGSRKVTLLPAHYDVDQPADLQRLMEDRQNLAFAPNTLAWLQTYYAR